MIDDNYYTDQRRDPENGLFWFLAILAIALWIAGAS